MALAITVTHTSEDQQGVYVRGTLAASGNYATGGDTLDFTTIPGRVPASQPPKQVWIAGTGGYSFGWVPGTTLANGKVKVNTTAATELGAGAYPAGITGDANIEFEAVFAKLL
jgi:hypothetical protein